MSDRLISLVMLLGLAIFVLGGVYALILVAWKLLRGLSRLLLPLGGIVVVLLVGSAFLWPEATADLWHDLSEWLSSPPRMQRDAERRDPSSTPAGSQPDPVLIGTGSGFVVSLQGHVLTNVHVIEPCGEVRLRRGPDLAEPADILATNPQKDLALLRLADTAVPIASFRQEPRIRLGEDVVAVGFPLQHLLASQTNLTTGVVSALAGPKNNQDVIQMTAPVQAGNSGGPLLDRSGQVIGMVVGKLDAVKTALATGDVPQNVNFAIKGSLIQSFLKQHGVPYLSAASAQAQPVPRIAQTAEQFTLMVECWE